MATMRRNERNHVRMRSASTFSHSSFLIETFILLFHSSIDMNRIFVLPMLTKQTQPMTRAVTRHYRVVTPSRGARARSDLLLPKSLQSNPGPDQRVFFFDIDNCLYPKSSGIPALMKDR